MTSMTTTHRPDSRWYHEPMMWLVVALPVAVVIAGIITIMLATDSGNDVWPTDVRRTAQVQVEDIAPDRAAIALGIQGELTVKPETGAITVQLSQVPDTVQQIYLDLIHPARANQDQSLTLSRAGKVFVGRLPDMATQVWTVLITEVNGEWRVSGRYDPEQARATLAPALSEGQ